MIPRYSRPEMSEIWSEESKFQIWFEIEAHACDAQAALGVILPRPQKRFGKKVPSTLTASTRLSVRLNMM